MSGQVIPGLLLWILYLLPYELTLRPSGGCAGWTDGSESTLPFLGLRCHFAINCLSYVGGS